MIPNVDTIGCNIVKVLLSVQKKIKTQLNYQDFIYTAVFVNMCKIRNHFEPEISPRNRTISTETMVIS